MTRVARILLFVLPVVLVACAPITGTHRAQSAGVVAVGVGAAEAGDADIASVQEGLAMVQAGVIQRAIDEHFTPVIEKYEALHAPGSTRVYSARGAGDALLYAALGRAGVVGAEQSVLVLGPAWAMAYWARGYALIEMARVREGRRDLERALALAPMDSQYESELAYTWQWEEAWETALAAYRQAADWAPLSGDADTTPQLECRALRGQGYALVELNRLDEAEAAYAACLKRVAGDPKSLRELDYIRGLRARKAR